MATYYPPPVPFIGGRQPYAPRQNALIPQSKPPGLRPPAWIGIVVGAWEPPLSSSYIPRRTQFVFTTISSVDLPPPLVYQNIYIIQRAWPQRDYGRPAGSEGNRIDNPPFGLQPWLATLLKQWEFIPAPQLNKKLTPPSFIPVLDNPPIGWPPQWLRTVLRAWEPGPPLPATLGPLVQPGPLTPDNPPFWGVPDSLLQIVAKWQPVNYIPMWGFDTVDDNPLVVDNPPFGYDPYQPVIRSSWDIIPFPQIAQVKLLQPFLGTFDNPPIGYPEYLTLSNILSQWEYHPPLPFLRLLVIPRSPDEPPYGIPYTWLWNILTSWQPGPPLPYYTVGRIIQSGDRPNPYRSPVTMQILGIWNPPPDYRPFIRGPYQNISAPVIPPPTGTGHRHIADMLRRKRLLGER